MDTSVPTGLRERKKRRTREEIIRAARELFAERGYDATGLADVAERADIALSTLFGYFKSKADLFFVGYDEVIDEFNQAIRSRPAGESAIDATIRWHAGFWERRNGADPSSEALQWWLTRRRIIDAEPELEGLEHLRYQSASETLAKAVAEDLGDEATALRPQLIAATKVALLITLNRELAKNPEWLANATAYEEYVCECLRGATDAIAAISEPQLTS